jgi:hypothetical protein
MKGTEGFYIIKFFLTACAFCIHAFIFELVITNTEKKKSSGKRRRTYHFGKLS